MEYLAEAKHEHRENAEQEQRHGKDKKIKTERWIDGEKKTA